MAERRMTHVVQQRRRARHRAFKRIPTRARTVKKTLRHMLRPHRMTKTRMLGTMIHIRRQPKLTHATQPLNLRGIDQ